MQHLGRCVLVGQRFAPERIRELSALIPEDHARVLAAFTEHGTERLKPVFEALEETISYDELHVMRMVALCLVDGAPAASVGPTSVETDACHAKPVQTG